MNSCIRNVLQILYVFPLTPREAFASCTDALLIFSCFREVLRRLQKVNFEVSVVQPTRFVLILPARLLCPLFYVRVTVSHGLLCCAFHSVSLLPACLKLAVPVWCKLLHTLRSSDFLSVHSVEPSQPTAAIPSLWCRYLQFARIRQRSTALI